MTNESYHFNRSMSLVRRILLSIAIIAFCTQIFIDSSDKNLYSALFAFAAFAPTCFIILCSRNSDIGRAFTGTAVFFIIAANSLVPMVGTVLTGNSLVVSLLHPVEVYFHRFLFAVILLCSHELVHSFVFKPLYRQMTSLGSILKSNLLLPPVFVWGIGSMGLFAHLLKNLSLPVEVVKTLDGFGFLLWAPFILLLPPYTYEKNQGKVYWLLGIFYIIQVGVSLAGNSRMAMVGPIAAIGAGWVIALMMGLVIVNTKLIIRFFMFGIIGLIIGGQLTDISTAILIERGARDDRSMADQLSATFDRFLEKEVLARYRTELKLENEYLSSNDDWKENYLNNDFVDRFIQIRADDNSFDRIYSYNDRSLSKLKDLSGDKVLALLPDPVLKLFNIKIDKLELNGYSTGDLIEVLSARSEPGYFRTGSITAHGYGLFGWWYPLVLLACYSLIFSIFQGILSLSVSYREAGLHVSTLALILAFKFFNDISLDGVGSLFGMLFRGVWQTMIIYFFAIWVITLVTKKSVYSLKVHTCPKTPGQR